MTRLKQIEVNVFKIIVKCLLLSGFWSEKLHHSKCTLNGFLTKSIFCIANFHSETVCPLILDLILILNSGEGGGLTVINWTPDSEQSGQGHSVVLSTHVCKWAPENIPSREE